GYVANAMTRAGSSAWHGLGYVYTEDDRLNAKDFQIELSGTLRPRLRQSQTGYLVGGPLRRSGVATRMFVSSSAELLNSNGKKPLKNVYVPSAGFIQYVNSPGFSVTNPARTLMNAYRPPESQPIPADPFV